MFPNPNLNLPPLPPLDPSISLPDTNIPVKKCNCKQSKCLKLYCECYASGIQCNSQCHCVNCLNNGSIDHQAAINNTLDKNPQAFQPKITLDIQNQIPMQDDSSFLQQQSIQQQVLLPSAKHNKGCACKKSRCLKKYCECFQANVLCTDICKCIDCANNGQHSHVFDDEILSEGENQSMKLYKLLLVKDKQHLEQIITDNTFTNGVISNELIQETCKNLLKIVYLTPQQMVDNPHIYEILKKKYIQDNKNTQQETNTKNNDNSNNNVQNQEQQNQIIQENQETTNKQKDKIIENDQKIQHCDKSLQNSNNDDDMVCEDEKMSSNDEDQNSNKQNNLNAQQNNSNINKQQSNQSDQQKEYFKDINDLKTKLILDYFIDTLKEIEDQLDKQNKNNEQSQQNLSRANSITNQQNNNLIQNFNNKINNINNINFPIQINNQQQNQEIKLFKTQQNNNNNQIQNIQQNNNIINNIQQNQQQLQQQQEINNKENNNSNNNNNNKVLQQVNQNIDQIIHKDDTENSNDLQTQNNKEDVQMELEDENTDIIHQNNNLQKQISNPNESQIIQKNTQKTQILESKTNGFQQD